MRQRRLLAVLAVLAFVAAACDDGSENAATSVSIEPTTVPVTVVGALPVITLTPVAGGEPMQVDTAIGEIEFTTFDGPEFYQTVVTPYGLVAVGTDAELRWSTDGGITWQGMSLVGPAARITTAADDVIVFGARTITRYSWNGSGWIEASRVTWMRPRPPIDQIVFGPKGVVATAGSRMFYSDDGVEFVEAAQGPDKELMTSAATGDCAGAFGASSTADVIPIMATENGFVAFTPADPSRWTDTPSCEPLLWFSTDGDVWQLMSQDSPFGRGAYVNTVWPIAGRDGRYVATGGLATEAAVWVSDDGLVWQRSDLELFAAFDVAVGPMGWMLSGVARGGDREDQSMWFSTDGSAWDGPFDLPEALHVGWWPPHLAVGVDTIFSVGMPGGHPVIGKLLG